MPMLVSSCLCTDALILKWVHYTCQLSYLHEAKGSWCCCIAGSNGSGVAQVLSVDEERQSGLNRSGRVSGDASSSKGLNNGKSQGGSGAGVSLFGSYKAPFKRQ